MHRAQDEGAYDPLVMHPYLPTEQIAIIIAQDPNETTIDHHLQMIYEQSIGLVIQFSNENEDIMLVDEFNGTFVSKKMLRRYEITNFLTKEVWDVTKEKRDKTWGWRDKKTFSQVPSLIPRERIVSCRTQFEECLSVLGLRYV